MSRTFVGRSESQLQLRDPEQHRVKSLLTLEENSRWLFVVSFYENQSIEEVSEYLSPGIVELHPLGRKHPINKAVVYSPNKISKHWPNQKLSPADIHMDELRTWRLKLTEYQDAQRERENTAREFTKIKEEPTEEMHEQMEEAKRKSKATRLEALKAGTGEFIKAVKEIKHHDFRMLNSMYETERLKRETLEVENARLKKLLASSGHIEIKTVEKRYKYAMYSFADGTPREIFSRTYDTKDRVQDFIKEQSDAATDTPGA